MSHSYTSTCLLTSLKEYYEMSNPMPDDEKEEEEIKRWRYLYIFKKLKS
tara:strand:- start:178 stop:324 length:147 start_codon:yes stop_codon:yes gene_type:complete